MLRHSSPSCLQVSLGLLVFYHSHYFQVGAPTCASILTCDWLHHNTEFCFHICLSLQTAEALRTALHLTLCLQVLLNQSPEGSLILWSPHTPRSPIQETSGLPLDGADGVGEEWGDGSGMQVPRGVHWWGGGLQGFLLFVRWLKSMHICNLLTYPSLHLRISRACQTSVQSSNPRIMKNKAVNQKATQPPSSLWKHNLHYLTSSVALTT